MRQPVAISNSLEDLSNDDEETKENEETGNKKDIKKSVERLDTEVITLHQNVTALSIEVRNAIQALQDFTVSSLQSTMNLSTKLPPARSIPNLPNPMAIEQAPDNDDSDPNTGMVRSTSHPPEMWGREMSTDSYITSEQLKIDQKFDMDFLRKTSIMSYNLPETTTSTQTDANSDYETIKRMIKSNPRLVFSILGAILPQKYRKMSLETINELSSSESIEERCQEEEEEEEISSPDDNGAHTEDITHPTHKNHYLFKEIAEAVELHINNSIENSMEHINNNRKSSGTSIKLQPQAGHGETCVIVLNENELDSDSETDPDDLHVKKRYNSLFVSKAPLTNRFSAGDADKVEKSTSTKTNNQLSRSLKEIWILITTKIMGKLYFYTSSSSIYRNMYKSSENVDK